MMFFLKRQTETESESNHECLGVSDKREWRQGTRRVFLMYIKKKYFCQYTIKLFKEKCLW